MTKPSEHLPDIEIPSSSTPEGKEESRTLTTEERLSGTQDKPSPIPYVELLAKSNFSFLTGASHPEEMVNRAQKLGYSGLGLCDNDGLYGVVRGYKAATQISYFETIDTENSVLKGKANDFKYLVGCEITLINKQVVALIVISMQGYTNLCRLMTLAKRNIEKYHMRITLQDLLNHYEGLLVCPIPPWDNETIYKLKEELEEELGFCSEEMFGADSEEESTHRSEKNLSRDFSTGFRRGFNNRVFLPVTRDLSWQSHIYNQKAFELEKDGFQLFVSQRPLFHKPERKHLHDAITCINHHKKIEEVDNLLSLNRERHLKKMSELLYLWRDRPDLVARTQAMASLNDFSFDKIRYYYPESELPKGLSRRDLMRKRCEEGIFERYGKSLEDFLEKTSTKSRNIEKFEKKFSCEALIKKFSSENSLTNFSQDQISLLQEVFEETLREARERLEKELKIIFSLEYEDYFLTLVDIIDFAREQKILYQGRGSAANSICCYVLGLTAIDPLEFHGTVERFISIERKEPPDIDIDFEHERREEVIQYIYKKYGPEYSGMVCTVIRYRARLALRELCKVFDIELETVNKLIKYLGKDGLKRLSEDPPPEDKIKIPAHKLKIISELTQQLVGFPRHIGIHTGGFIISHKPLVDLVPIEKATMQDRYVIQWNKDDVDTLKMMKIDVLSLGMLTAIRKCFDILRHKKQTECNLTKIPHDDLDTYKMIQAADTVGVFQIESRAQMSMLPRFKPKDFYDLVIEVAIVRPGPLQGGMVHPYLKRRQGKEKVDDIHPELKDVLGRTFGIPIFQEQVLLIPTKVAGFSPGEADEMRRLLSLSWRKQGHMSELRKRLISGMEANGLTKEYAEQIYKSIEGFASYGFPESHSASFALLTYVSSFLKCHHPDVFACALLNSQPMGFYSPRTLIADAQRHGVQFLPLDIQESDYDYKLETLNSEYDTKADHNSKARTSFDYKLNTPNSETGTSASQKTNKRPTTTLTPDYGAVVPAHPPTNRGTSRKNYLRNPPGKNQYLLPVRIGFRSLYGVSEDVMNKVIEEREKNGPFKDLSDLIKRTHTPRAILLKLAQAGTLKSFGRTPRELVWKISSLELDLSSLVFSLPQQSFEKPISYEKQPGYFADSPTHFSKHQISKKDKFLTPKMKSSSFENWIPKETPATELNREYQTKGFSLDGHPMKLHRAQLKEANLYLTSNKWVPYSTTIDIDYMVHGQKVRTAGMIGVHQRPPTAKGFAFLTLEDETGLMNIVLKPPIYKKFKNVIQYRTLIEVHGKLEYVEGVRNIMAAKLFPLQESEFMNGSRRVAPRAF